MTVNHSVKQYVSEKSGFGKTFGLESGHPVHVVVRIDLCYILKKNS